MKQLVIATLIIGALFSSSCKEDPKTAQLRFSVSLAPNETYTYNTEIGGDEEGVTIVQQASHFEVSEIVRDQSTEFIAIYQYQPEQDFTGSDWVELRLETGSDGASLPVEATLVRIEFTIAD